MSHAIELVQAQLPGGIEKIALIGSLDASAAATVESNFAEIADRSGKVIIDLSSVTFLGSAGVHIIVRTAKHIGERGGRLVVLGPTKASLKVLHATGVDSVIPIVVSEADAVARLS